MSNMYRITDTRDGAVYRITDESKSAVKRNVTRFDEVEQEYRSFWEIIEINFTEFRKLDDLPGKFWS